MAETKPEVATEEKREEPLHAERLESKIAPAILNPKKGPIPPPYPPGADYSLIKRSNLLRSE
jgi:hypothetical protein